MKKNIIEKELTLEEQVQQNKQNIESQIALTNTNTTDIQNLKVLNDIDGILVTDKTLGNLSDLNTDDKTTIVAAINEVDANVNSVSVVNDTQNNRLSIIESSLTNIGSDYSLLSDTGTVTDVSQVITPTITRDFEASEIADNIINTTSGQLTTKIFKASTVTANFWFNCQQATGDTARFSLKLWNDTTNTLIDEAIINLDFAGGITINNPTRTVKGVVGAGDVVSVRVQVDTGKTVQVISSGMDLEVAVKQGTINNIYDYQVISSGSLGNENVAADIVSLNNKKAEASVVTNIDQRLGVIENADLINGLNLLGTRVTANETSISNLNTKITAAETDITNLKNDKVETFLNRPFSENLTGFSYTREYNTESSKEIRVFDIKVPTPSPASNNVDRVLLAVSMNTTTDGTFRFRVGDKLVAEQAGDLTPKSYVDNAISNPIRKLANKLGLSDQEILEILK